MIQNILLLRFLIGAKMKLSNKTFSEKPEILKNKSRDSRLRKAPLDEVLLSGSNFLLCMFVLASFSFRE